MGPNEGISQSPVGLVSRVLSQMKSQQAQVILVALVQKGQPWYPVLLGMLFDYSQATLSLWNVCTSVEL